MGMYREGVVMEEEEEEVIVVVDLVREEGLEDL